MARPDHHELYGAFVQMRPLLIVHERLRAAMLDTDLVWLLPPGTLPGVTAAYGLPVLRADVPAPLLAHRPQQDRPPMLGGTDETGD